MDPTLFFHTSDANIGGRFNLARKLIDYKSSCALLLGPSRSGKTSLAFHWALSQATRGMSAMFVTPSQHQFELHPPLFFEGERDREGEKEAKALRAIDIKYVHDVTVLRALLASLHTCETLPDVIIIDSLTAYAQPCKTLEEAAQVAELFALLVDATNHCTRKSAARGGGPCTCLVVDDITNSLAEESGNLPNLAELCSDWLPLVCRIQENVQGHTMKLSVQTVHGSADPYRLAVEYQVTPESSLLVKSIDFAPIITPGDPTGGKVVSLNVLGRYYKALRSGEKCVEVRLDKGSASSVMPDDFLLVNGTLLLKVVRVTRYPSFEKCVNGEGVRCCVPDARHVTDAVDVYRGFYTEEMEKRHGVVAYAVRVTLCLGEGEK